MMTTPPTTDPRLDLAPPATAVRVWLFALVVALPLAITATPMVVGLASSGSKHIAAVNAIATWAGVLGGVCVLVLAIWAILERALRRHRLGVDASGIEIATTFYKRRVPLAELDLDHARVIDLDEHTELKPLFKTSGFALPGLSSGWFRSRGLRKLFVASVGGKRLLWLPTRAGYDLLLQPRNPQALLDRLRELAAHAPRR